MINSTPTTSKLNDPYLIFSVSMIFVAQLLYYLANAGFFSAFFSGANQGILIDMLAIQAVREHFWQSMFYYHLTPPLYAIYTYLFVFWFPPDGEMGIYILHSALGVYAIYSMYSIQKNLGINSKLACLLCTIFALSPSFNLEETMGFYDFPTACLLIISSWKLLLLLQRPRFMNAFLFFFSIALLCSIRSLYHVLFYMLPVIGVTTLILRKNWRIILLASIIPFILVFSVYLKNYMVFHIFSTSSYFGETLDSIVMRFNVTLEQREMGVKKGFFSDMALCPGTPDSLATREANFKYTGYYCYLKIAEKYRDRYIKSLGKDYSNIPILSDKYAFTLPDGSRILHRNAIGRIGMSQEVLKNSIQAIIHYPDEYWTGLKSSWRLYFTNGVSYYFDSMGNPRHIPVSLSMSWLRLPLMQMPDNNIYVSIPMLVALPFLFFFAICYTLYSRKAIAVCLALYTFVFLLTSYGIYAILANHHFQRFSVDWGLHMNAIMTLLGMLAIISIIVAIFRLFIYFYQTKKMQWLIPASSKHNDRMVILFIFSTILYTSLIITMTVGSEQQRYRFYIDGLYYILFGLFLQTMIIPVIENCIKSWGIHNHYKNPKNPDNDD
jgi:hypothetical protein